MIVANELHGLWRDLHKRISLKSLVVDWYLEAQNGIDNVTRLILTLTPSCGKQLSSLIRVHFDLDTNKTQYIYLLKNVVAMNVL